MMYAKYTQVPARQTRDEIEKMLKKYGVTATGFFTNSDQASVIFDMCGRRIRFTMKFPTESSAKKTDQAYRARWRSLLMCIRAKLDTIETGLETFDEAFLAHIVADDGQTIYERSKPTLAALKDTINVPLIPPPEMMR